MFMYIVVALWKAAIYISSAPLFQSAPFNMLVYAISFLMFGYVCVWFNFLI